MNITVERPTRNVTLAQGENPLEGTPFGEFFRFLPQPDAGPQRGLGSAFIVSDDGYLQCVQCAEPSLRGVNPTEATNT